MIKKETQSTEKNSLLWSVIIKHIYKSLYVHAFTRKNENFSWKRETNDTKCC